MRSTFLLAGMLAVLAAPVVAGEPWTVKPEWVQAHEAFLASDALRGRGSATPDEAIAASYVASQFQGYGLKPAPGMDGYLQTAWVVKPKLSGAAILTVGSEVIHENSGLTLLRAGRDNISGTLQVATSNDPGAVPAGDVLLVPDLGKATFGQWLRAGTAKGAKLVIFRETDDTKKRYAMGGGQTSVSITLEDQQPSAFAVADMATVAPDTFDRLAAMQGAAVKLDMGETALEKSLTTNAIGYLPGSDPTAGIILVTAHLDHLGVQSDGTIMHGANDDASGVTAVLEVAHAMAAGPQPKRGILFVGYGSEEIGGLGSQYFGAHPPVPLGSIVTNLEFEMIGAQDPKMTPGVMMMTGFDRSDLGETLQAHGALVAPDIYPDQHFFERSDNYSLALQGIVAHTISGWAVTPTYHDKTDDLAHLDIPFMTQAIQSLIEPVRYLANSDFTPQWKPGGRPEPRK